MLSIVRVLFCFVSGPSPFSPTAGAYAHLAHMPSAFSMLGRHAGFPPVTPFGGLGTLTDGLGSPLRSPPGTLGHNLSPTTGNCVNTHTHTGISSTSLLSIWGDLGRN